MGWHLHRAICVYDGYRFKFKNIDDRIRNINVLMIDKKGRMWIGTNDNGVACYDTLETTESYILLY